ncbi:hypothetical protein ART_3385 [Arthrobacter sp. PAMC 25486]|nr:DUF4192 family protein [Arthrobacter sp. PAMC 25486]AIY02984.1 hypothetical protein ART_3385 [Arthrobacter sp. PAMC 25486]
MEKLSIKTPDDFIALMGHSLGFWPEESLVCVILDDRRIGATLRVNLPVPGTDTKHFIDQVVHHVGTDCQATGVVFGIFTHAPCPPIDLRPHEGLMEELTGRLGQQGVIIRDGWLIGETIFTNYLLLGTDSSVSHPLDRVLSTEFNAELVFRGSSIEASPRFRIPVLARPALSTEILRHCFRIKAMNPHAAITRARTLWNRLLDDGSEPTDDEAAELIANLKFISVWDRILSDIPGIDDSMRDLLLGQTKKAPAGSASSAPPKCCSSSTCAQTVPMLHPCSPASASSNGGKTAAAKLTSVFNASWKQTPSTDWPNSQTSSSAKASSLTSPRTDKPLTSHPTLGDRKSAEWGLM